MLSRRLAIVANPAGLTIGRAGIRRRAVYSIAVIHAVTPAG